MNRTATKKIIGLSIAILLAGTQGSVAAPTTGPSTIEFHLATQKPATGTAARLEIEYRSPDDAATKPPAIQHLRIELPPGTKLRLSEVPACASTDAEIMLQGPSACPPASKVGSGTLVAITGFGAPIDPFTTEVTIFNTGEGFLEVVQDSTGATLATDRIKLEGGALVGNPPAIPGGPPDGRTAVGSIDFGFPAAAGYFVSPSRCPGNGWRTHASFDFADGSSQEALSTTPCSERAKSPRGVRCSRTIRGTAQGDRLRGTARGDRIRGGGGPDKIAGREGRDCLFGGRGKDRIRGQAGNDRISGNGGNDRIRGGSGSDVIRARGGGVDRIDCGRGRDTVQAGPRDRLRRCEVLRR